MPPAASKFGVPTAGKDTDAGKFRKLAERVEETLTKESLFPEPKQLDPCTVLVAPFNRDGAPPNVKHIHHTILKSFKEKGFDRSRPHVGICVMYTSEEGKKKLLEHNKRFSKGNPLLPPIEDGKALYGSLAGSHLNLALRCIKAKTSSPVGDLGDLYLTTPKVQDTVNNGHRWFILPETVSKVAQLDISLWRNQDQNENQGTHEIEILQTVKTTAEDLSKGANKVTQGDLVARAARRNAAKISPLSLQTLTKFYVGFLENGKLDLVDDLVDFHSTNVDPKELVVSTAFYQCLTSEPILQKCPYMRLSLVCTQYSTEKLRAQAGGASISCFLESTQIVTLCKKTDLLVNVENKLAEARKVYLPLLEPTLGEKQARLELQVYADLILRCLLAKPWPELDPKVDVPAGRYSNDSPKNLGICWAKYLDKKHPGFDFAKASGLTPLVKEEDKEDKEDEKEVSLEGVRPLSRGFSEPQDPEALPKFKRGDEVTVVRRMTWAVPHPTKADYRKDINVGTEGVIEGFADCEQRQVLLKVILDLPGAPKSEVVHSAYPRNLQLSKDYNKASGSSGAQEDGKEEKEENEATADGKRTSEAPKWLVGDSDPAGVKKENSWKSLLSDSESLTRAWYLRSRIGSGMQALWESLPTWSDKDLVVAHRKNEKGIWRDELWTARDFDANELLLAPFTSQLKDTHLMASGHAVVDIPKHGRGAHPDGQSMALDGRTRNLIAKKGVLDESEHKGSLFWIVGRTSKASEANLSLEPISFEQKTFLTLPNNKKRKISVDWGASEMPAIPILVNKKALKAHTQLLVFHADKKKEPEKSKD